MPIRTRLRRAFTRSSSDEDAARKTSSKTSKTESNIYQPGEKMPPMKYRRPVAPEHKEKLEAFSWAKAWRPRSIHSIYSPMGSRMPSRKASLSTLGRRSIGGRKGSSRGTDGMGVDSGFGGSIDGDGHERLREGSDEEGDVTNVGLSRAPTEDPRKPSPGTANCRSQSLHRRSQSASRPSSSRPATGTSNGRSQHSQSTTKADTPFSPEELELALKQSHLESSREESYRSADASPGSPGSPGSPPVVLRPREIQFAS